MVTIAIFSAVLAVLIGAGSVISHERSGEEFHSTSKVPTLFERLFSSAE